ncbi:hypothetical protein PLICRDRAFT_33197 [Plicaturopsis crispa FD-325 SS-3]|uniref:DUF8190 domain-containing protein n=1 Tax=Plicaturopsis crispa FD-325 SS-3 TaxID=944288 RepID=A0A0C9T116_PLICR|nr:hypothetical protein PLICRDRAFT_33197 [Plicaturopsis crispa FD-325 SS-3]
MQWGVAVYDEAKLNAHGRKAGRHLARNVWLPVLSEQEEERMSQYLTRLMEARLADEEETLRRNKVGSKGVTTVTEQYDQILVRIQRETADSGHAGRWGVFKIPEVLELLLTLAEPIFHQHFAYSAILAITWVTRAIDVHGGLLLEWARVQHEVFRMISSKALFPGETRVRSMYAKAQKTGNWAEWEGFRDDLWPTDEHEIDEDFMTEGMLRQLNDVALDLWTDRESPPHFLCGADDEQVNDMWKATLDILKGRARAMSKTAQEASGHPGVGRWVFLHLDRASQSALASTPLMTVCIVEQMHKTLSMFPNAINEFVSWINPFVKYNRKGKRAAPVVDSWITLMRRVTLYDQTKLLERPAELTRDLAGILWRGRKDALALLEIATRATAGHHRSGTIRRHCQGVEKENKKGDKSRATSKSAGKKKATAEISDDDMEDDATDLVALNWFQKNAPDSVLFLREDIRGRLNKFLTKKDRTSDLMRMADLGTPLKDTQLRDVQRLYKIVEASDLPAVFKLTAADTKTTTVTDATRLFACQALCIDVREKLDGPVLAENNAFQFLRAAVKKAMSSHMPKVNTVTPLPPPQWSFWDGRPTPAEVALPPTTDSIVNAVEYAQQLRGAWSAMSKTVNDLEGLLGATFPRGTGNDFENVVSAEATRVINMVQGTFQRGLAFRAHLDKVDKSRPKPFDPSTVRLIDFRKAKVGQVHDLYPDNHYEFLTPTLAHDQQKPWEALEALAAQLKAAHAANTPKAPGDGEGAKKAQPASLDEDIDMDDDEAQRGGTRRAKRVAKRGGKSATSAIEVDIESEDEGKGKGPGVKEKQNKRVTKPRTDNLDKDDLEAEFERDLADDLEQAPKDDEEEPEDAQQQGSAKSGTAAAEKDLDDEDEEPEDDEEQPEDDEEEPEDAQQQGTAKSGTNASEDDVDKALRGDKSGPDAPKDDVRGNDKASHDGDGNGGTKSDEDEEMPAIQQDAQPSHESAPNDIEMADGSEGGGEADLTDAADANAVQVALGALNMGSSRQVVAPSSLNAAPASPDHRTDDTQMNVDVGRADADLSSSELSPKRPFSPGKPLDLNEIMRQRRKARAPKTPLFIPDSSADDEGPHGFANNPSTTQSTTSNPSGTQPTQPATPEHASQRGSPPPQTQLSPAFSTRSVESSPPDHDYVEPAACRLLDWYNDSTEAQDKYLSMRRYEQLPMKLPKLHELDARAPHDERFIDHLSDPGIKFPYETPFLGPIPMEQCEMAFDDDDQHLDVVCKRYEDRDLPVPSGVAELQEWCEQLAGMNTNPQTRDVFRRVGAAVIRHTAVILRFEEATMEKFVPSTGFIAYCYAYADDAEMWDECVAYLSDRNDPQWHDPYVAWEEELKTSIRVREQRITPPKRALSLSPEHPQKRAKPQPTGPPLRRSTRGQANAEAAPSDTGKTIPRAASTPSTSSAGKQPTGQKKPTTRKRVPPPPDPSQAKPANVNGPKADKGGKGKGVALFGVFRACLHPCPLFHPSPSIYSISLSSLIPVEAMDAADGVDGAADDVPDLEQATSIDVAELARTIEAEDGLSPDAIRRSLQGDDREPDKYASQYDRTLPIKVPLSRFRYNYENQRVAHAYELLKKRIQITVDPEYILDADDPDLMLTVDRHFIDFFCAVSSGIGLHAIIPKAITDPLNKFSFSPQHYRDFKPKYAKLGFDPAGRMLFIGKRGDMDAWIAFAPNEAISENPPDCPAGLCSGNTRLTPHQYRVVLAFIAWSLSNDHVENIYSEKYPDVSSQETLNNDTVGAFDDEIKLDLEQMRALSLSFETRWFDWLDGAPDTYIKDDFFRDHTPISVLSKFGQDQRIFIPTPDDPNHEEEALQFDRDINFERLRYFTVALASHLTAPLVHGWVELNQEELAQRFPELFDHWDPANRLPVDITTTPVLDESGAENCVYDRDGKRIFRREAWIDGENRGHGILLRFDDIEDLFPVPQPDLDAMDLDDDDFDFDAGVNGPELSLYPQAYLHRYGNLQSKTYPQPVQRIVDNINRACMDEMAGEDDDAHPLPPLGPMTFYQIYSATAHRLKPRGAGSDPAQTGQATQVFVGADVQGARSQTKLNKKVAALDANSLPYDRSTRLLEDPSLDSSLRFEGIYHLNLMRLPEHRRTGRHCFKGILMVIAAGMESAYFVEPVKRHIILLESQIFPMCYLWTSYGHACSIESLWEAHRDDIVNKKPISPYIVEALAIQERNVNFCFTGNGKVFSTSLQNPLWSSRGAMEDGWPCLSPVIVFVVGEFLIIIIKFKHWPKSKKTGMPLTASDRTCILTWGGQHYMASSLYQCAHSTPSDFYAHFQRYKALFRIAHAANVTPIGIAPPALASKPLTANGFIIAYFALEVYVHDVVELVTAGVNAMAAAEANDADPIKVRHGQTRLTMLKSWAKSKHPLDYGDAHSTYITLASILHPTTSPTQGLPLRTRESMTLSAWATDLVNRAEKWTPQNSAAPIIASGAFPHIFPVALSNIQRYLSPDLGREQRNKKVINLFVGAATRLKIRHVPYSPLPQAGAPPRRAPLFDVWVNVGAEDTPMRSGIPAELVDEEMENQEQAEEAANEVVRIDANAEWTATRVALPDLHRYLHKAVPPTDFSIALANIPARDDYVRKTYVWAIERFSMADPIHQLGLIAAFIFTLCLPIVGAPRDAPQSLVGLNIRDPEVRRRSTEIIRQTPWVLPGKGPKGVTAAPPFITMFTVYFMALEDETSPLRKRMEESGQQAIGNVWGEKHREKQMGPLNFVRMGLGWASGAQVFRGAVWDSSWRLHSHQRLITIHQKWTRLLKTAPFGPFLLLVDVLGSPKALEVASARRIRIPPNAAPTRSISLTASKRRRESDDEDDTEPVHRHPFKPPRTGTS